MSRILILSSTREKYFKLLKDSGYDRVSRLFYHLTRIHQVRGLKEMEYFVESWPGGLDVKLFNDHARIYNFTEIDKIPEAC